VRSVEVRLLPIGIRELILTVIRRLAGKRNRAQSSFATAAVSGDVTAVDLESLTLRISLYSALVPVLRRLVRSLWRSALVLKGCFAGGSFNGVHLLDASYRGIKVGDLAASESLRFGRGEVTSLQCTLNLWRMLADSILICDLCFDDIELTQGSAVFALEPTYRHSVYKRALRARGADVIEMPSYDSGGSFRIIGPSEELRHPDAVKPPSAPPTTLEREQAALYMEARLASPQQHLPYMVTGGNRDTDQELRSVTGEAVTVDGSNLTIALFLHSFDDAQYYFGCDGYSDLLEWTDTTIRLAVDNASVGRVLIKAHPNSEESIYPKSRRSELWLQNRYARENRVTWIDRRTSLRAIASIPHVVGITHHGSVAEELVFLGVPTIASRTAPWGDSYRFVRTWATPAEYEKMLAAVSLANYGEVSAEERDSLLTFLSEYRLRPFPATSDNLYWYRAWRKSIGTVVVGDDVLLQGELSALDFAQARAYLSFLMKAEDLGTFVSDAQRIQAESQT
jgi:hypothetical protein